MTQENKIYTTDEAAKLGFTIKRDEAVKIFGSSATLGRKLAKMTKGEHYVLVEGKTKPTPVFGAAIYKLAGIETGEIIPDPEYIEVEVKKNSKSSQNNLKKNSNESIQEAVITALILPNKMAYNLDEAAMISGIPKSYIKAFAIDTVVGYRITRERLVECKDEFFSTPYARPKLGGIVAKKPTKKKSK